MPVTRKVMVSADTVSPINSIAEPLWASNKALAMLSFPATVNSASFSRCSCAFFVARYIVSATARDIADEISVFNAKEVKLKPPLEITFISVAASNMVSAANVSKLAPDVTVTAVPATSSKFLPTATAMSSAASM